MSRLLAAALLAFAAPAAWGQTYRPQDSAYPPLSVCREQYERYAQEEQAIVAVQEDRRQWHSLTPAVSSVIDRRIAGQLASVRGWKDHWARCIAFHAAGEAARDPELQARLARERERRAQAERARIADALTGLRSVVGELRAAEGPEVLDPVQIDDLGRRALELQRLALEETEAAEVAGVVAALPALKKAAEVGVTIIDLRGRIDYLEGELRKGAGERAPDAHPANLRLAQERLRTVLQGRDSAWHAVRAALGSPGSARR